MSELTPITRIESYLDAIVNSGTPPLEDITRIETFLQAIYDNTVCALTPITRIEMFLGKISGQDIVLPEPITRVELYLAAIAGEDVELPETPITRLEMYLAEWADSGDWTTISGAIVEFVAQRAHKLKSCVVSLSPIQDLHGYDSPWPEGGGKNLVKNEWRQGNYSSLTNTNVITIAECPLVEAGETYSVSVIGLDFTVYKYVVYGSENATGTSNTARPDSGWLTVQSATFVPIDTNPYIGISITRINGAAITPSDLPSTLKIQVEKGSTPTAWSPYENICPISGWTGCEVKRTGKNLIDPSKKTKYADTIYRWYEQDGFLLKAGQTYTLSRTSDGGTVYIRFMGSTTNYYGDPSVTFTPTEDTLVYFQLYRPNDASGIDVQLELGSTATAYEPYQGEEVSVTFPTVNIWDEEWEEGTIVDGVKENASNRIRTKNYIPVRPNTKYCFYDRLCFFEYGVDKTYISNTGFIGTNTPSPTFDTFTTGNNTYYLMFITTTVYGTTYGNNLFINYPSIFTDYYAYGEPMTVYGGEPDIVSGKMPVTMGKVDMGDLTWVSYSEENKIIRADVPGKANGVHNLISSTYKTSTAASHNSTEFGFNEIIGINNTSFPNRIYLRSQEAYSDYSLLNGVQLCFELATPSEIQLTPQEVTALKGYNAMWSDADSIEVTVHGTLVEVSTPQALNMLLGGAYHNNQTADDVSDDEALDIILGGEQR